MGKRNVELNLVGQKYNMLSVIEHHHKTEGNMNYWLCRCDCGNTTIVSTHNLRTNAVKSCGCLSKIVAKRKRLDLTGKTFSFLTVLERIPREYNAVAKWKCLCSCGNIFVASQGDLIQGYTKSCGCYRRRRLAFGENGFNRLYDTYRRRAKQKNFDFDLSKEEFKEITSKNCYYCGIEPHQKAPATAKKNYGFYTYNGIDRIDSSIGYTKENIVPCCGQCNVAKNNHGQQEFFDWIKRVNENISKINCSEEI